MNSLSGSSTHSLPAPGDAASAPSAPSGVAHPKGIKSFVRRAGRTTTGQSKALETLGPRFILPFAAQDANSPVCWPNWSALYGREAPLILEIGFGMGEATAHIARVRPECNFLCCEVHEPGVGALLKRMEEQSIGNIRIVAHDAVQVLRQMIEPRTLSGIHIFFPDPWHKKRHHKRRLIQTPFVRELAEHLRPGGYLHCATDWQPYAEQMREVLQAEPLLRNRSSAPEGYTAKPDYRPLTKFESRGLRLGHGVWDLVFERRP